MPFRPGQVVAYTGYDTPDLSLGDTGKVIISEAGVSHVKWAQNEQTLPVHDYSLSPQTASGVTAMLDDSTTVGGLVSFAVRETYDDGGETAVLNAMIDGGHLGAFASIAEEALGKVMSSIRLDPSFRAVLANLDEEEGESLLRLAGMCLMRDAFDEGESV
jgi:hypothetical protein